MLGDNEKYKQAVLADIRRQFSGPAIGIGDKASDARAYARAGLRALLILRLSDPPTPAEFRRAAGELHDLPDSVEVVTGWDEVQKAVFEGKVFPAAKAKERLSLLADELEKRR
jgi:hypothetical protein